MHSEINILSKEIQELNFPLSFEQHISFLEEDLTSGSCIQDFIIGNISVDCKNKLHNETIHQSLKALEFNELPLIYVNEDTMDCNYEESSNISKHFELPDVSSPELFDSDADDEAKSANNTLSFQNVLNISCISLSNQKKFTSAEHILKADKYLLQRGIKFLSGVPPPPNHTISQKDCNDFLVYITQNRQYFWADPFKLNKNNIPKISNPISLLQKLNENRNEGTNLNCTHKEFYSVRTGLRNLTTAFDACEQPSYLKLDNQDSVVVDAASTDINSLTLQDKLFTNCSILSKSTFATFNNSKIYDIDKEISATMFISIKVEDAAILPWPDAYKHKCHDIYYNRNKAIEDFENIRIKLCDRYVGAETQSTCNVWFTKHTSSNVRKTNLVTKFKNGQSPGKRLSYLARRRRTFSSANLQGLGFAEKKQFIINVRKGFARKGKSPRTKSPRGKTPRTSTKKCHFRRFMLEGSSPKRTKIESSKKALFQSPPLNKANFSQTVRSDIADDSNSQKIKRVLFPTPKKNDGNVLKIQSLSHPESRKRKTEEELKNPLQKWPKSLSFDCVRNLNNSSLNNWNFSRHSISGVLPKDGTPNHGKCELSETHRKKLLWAVAEALRTKGIGMNHPLFKQYASSLARTVRKFIPDLENKNVPRKPGSTSDRMLKLAKRYVLLIVEAD